VIGDEIVAIVKFLVLNAEPMEIFPVDINPGRDILSATSVEQLVKNRAHVYLPWRGQCLAAALFGLCS
jgi:hypothetical protein